MNISICPQASRVFAEAFKVEVEAITKSIASAAEETGGERLTELATADLVATLRSKQ